MLDPKKREGLRKLDADFLEIIDKYGWHVMNVAPSVDSDKRPDRRRQECLRYLRAPATWPVLASFVRFVQRTDGFFS